MSRWRMGVALLAAWLGLGAAVQAQYAPGPGGPPPVEPMPSAPSTIAPEAPPSCPPGKPLPPPGVPGPMPPWMAPQGPPDPLQLPNDGTGAFPCEITPPESACFFHMGAIALQRQTAGTMPTAVNYALFSNIAGGGQVAQDYSQVPLSMAWGPKATIGYLLGDESIELTAFYLFPNNSTVESFRQLGLQTPFYNAPQGFGGFGNRSIPSTNVNTTISTSLINAEINYRFWDPAYAGWEAIIGVRYFDIKDGTQITGYNNGFLGSLPQAAEIYSARAQNYMVLPQLGLEYFYAPCRWFQAGIVGKGAWGPNFINTVVTLNRGDGNQGFDTHTNKTTFGQLYQLGAYVDLNPHPRIHFRGGFNAYWVTGIATGPDQVDYNLQDTAGKQNTNGSLFFYGPQLELQFLF